MNTGKLKFYIFFIAPLLSGCLDRYAAPKVSDPDNYVVVSGFLNARDSACTITLTRSHALSSSGTSIPILDANVELQSQDGITFELPSTGAGGYSNLKIRLNLASTYRLHINLSGSDYFSTYVPITQSPPIDSVGWSLVRSGAVDPNVNIYVNSTGANDQSRYYLWNFQETWFYSAAYPSYAIFENGQVLSIIDTTYFCWHTLNSNPVLIASTDQLSENVVNQFSVASIPINSVKLSREYSILINQLTITQDAFEYWQQLKANTENLGTIFGSQPSQFNGNLYSAANPSEPVFGYFMAAVPAQKRIFIKASQLPRPSGAVITGYEGCRLDTLTVQMLESSAGVSSAGGSSFVFPYGSPATLGYLITSKSCTDCRTQGGTTTKPSFWH